MQQSESDQIKKYSVLWLPALLGSPYRETWRGEKEKGKTTENRETRCLFWGEGAAHNINSLWEWSLPSLGRDYHLVGFLDSPWGGVAVCRAFLTLLGEGSLFGGGVRTEATPRAVPMEWCFLPNIPKVDAMGLW